MAKSKTVARPASKLPAGFKAIEHLGDFWNGKEPGDNITGKLVSKKVKHFAKGKYAARDANVYVIDVKGKKLEVTQSGGLGALEDVKKGQSVYIEFLGMKKLAGKKEKMKEYLVAVK